MVRLQSRGDLKVVESPNPFEEKLTLRHKGDFGGGSDDRWFQWVYMPADFSGIPDSPADNPAGWQPFDAVVPDALPPASGQAGYPFATGAAPFHRGAVDTMVLGSGQQLLTDKWFAVRYFSEGVCGTPDDYHLPPPAPALQDNGNLSPWTKPQLYEGWLKRVMKRINLFDQKVRDFHESEVDTLASMISLAGRRYEGDVALSDDPAYLNRVGLIELYETLLRRALGLSIDGTPRVNQSDLNKAVLLAANRLAGLYLLLGNEAFADAAEPTRLIKLKSWQEPRLVAASAPLHADVVQIAVDAGVSPSLVWVANGSGPGRLLQLAGSDLSLKADWGDNGETLSFPRQSGNQPILNIDPQTGDLYVEDDFNYRLKQYGTVYRIDQAGNVLKKWPPFFFNDRDLEMTSPWFTLDYEQHFRHPREPCTGGARLP